MRFRVRAAGLVALALAGLGAWLVLRGDGPRTATPPHVAAPDVAQEPPIAADSDPASRTRVRVAPDVATPEDGDTDEESSPDVPARIEGQVLLVDDDGEDSVEERALPDAEVTLLVRPRAPWADADDEWWFQLDLPAEVIARTVTDADGHFSFPGEHVPRRLIVRAQAAGFASAQVMGSEFDGPIVIYIGAQPTLVRVRVVDSADRPVTTAVALLYEEAGQAPICAFHPDPSGRFEIPVESHEIVIRAPGFAPLWLEDPCNYDGRTVVLRPGTTLAGVVQDTDGAPLAGAAVRIDWMPVRPVTTDADGRFGFADVPVTSDYVDVYATAPGRLMRSANARPGATDVRIELPLPSRISGSVVDQDGQPVRGARLLSSRGGYLYSFGKTDAAGRFDRSGVDPGAFRLQAVLETPLDGFAPEVTPPGSRGEVTVQTAPGEHVAGVRIVVMPVPVSFVCVTIVDGDGMTVNHGSVSIPPEVEGDLGTQLGSRATWRWWRVLVAPGTEVPVQVNAIDTQGQVQPLSFTVTTTATPDGPPAILTVVPPETAPHVTLRLVTVRTDGLAIAEDADVSWQCTIDTARPSAAQRVGGPTGVIKVRVGDTVSVIASADGCATRTFRAHEVTEDTIFTCALPPEAVVVGRLVTASGTPVDRAWGYAIVVLPDGSESRSEFGTEQLGADGRFELARLGAGRCRVRIYTDDGDRIRAQHTLDLREGQRVDLGDVVVDRLPVVRGTIVRDGVPTGGIAVTAWSDDGLLASTSSGPDGAFELAVVDEDGGELVVENDEYDGSVTYDLAEARANSPVRLAAGTGEDVTIALAGGVADEAWTLETTCRIVGGVRVVPDDDPTGDVVTLYYLPRARVEVVIRAVDDETGTVHAVWRGVVTPRNEPQEVTFNREN